MSHRNLVLCTEDLFQAGIGVFIKSRMWWTSTVLPVPWCAVGQTEPSWSLRDPLKSS